MNPGFFSTAELQLLIQLVITMHQRTRLYQREANETLND